MKISACPFVQLFKVRPNRNFEKKKEEKKQTYEAHTDVEGQTNKRDERKEENTKG